MFVSPVQSQSAVRFADEDSSLVVLGFKYAKSHQVIEKPQTEVTVPAAAMIPDNKNFQRNVRANAPTGVRDPNADTIDGRSAALEKSVQEARAPQPKAVDGYAYKAKVQNAGKKVVEIVFWEYQFKEASTPETLVRRQFLCGVNIKPDKEKELQAFSLSGPSDVVSVGTLANKSGSLLQEKVVINRVEYADGTIWQRKGWKFAEIKLTFERAIATPWGAEMCRNL
jgi:hypothetical protein